MPIKGLTDRKLAFPPIGQVKKGMKVKGKTKAGKEFMRPVDLDYFLVEFDEGEEAAALDFLDAYPTQKLRDINIIFPFNDIDRAWDAWYKAYNASRMVAKSDGEHMEYLGDLDTGDWVVLNGKDKDGNKVKHMEVPGKQKNGKNIPWKPVGILTFVVPELKRAATMRLVTKSIWDVINITAQLKAALEITGGQLAGIPFVLKRRPQEVSTPMGDGKRQYQKKWLCRLEISQKWMDLKLVESQQRALPQLTEIPQLTVNVELDEPDNIEEDINPDDFVPDKAQQDAKLQAVASAEIDSADPETGEIPIVSVAMPRELVGEKLEGVQVFDENPDNEAGLQDAIEAREVQYQETHEAEPETEPEAEPVQDWLPPKVILEKFLKHSIETFEDDIGTPLTAAQKSLMRMAICMCFVGQEQSVVNDKYKTVLNYLTGVKSTANQALDLAMLKAIVEVWLRCKRESPADPYYLDNPNAAKEAEAIVSAALIGEGQEQLAI